MDIATQQRARASEEAGIALLRAGQNYQAAKKFAHVTKVQKNSISGWYNRGLAEYRLGNYTSAIDYFHRSLNLKLDDRNGLFMLACALCMDEQHNEVVSICDIFVKLFPNDADAHCQRGISLICLKEVEEGLRSLDRAIAIDPEHREARCGRSMALLSRGDWLRGWEDWELRHTIGAERDFVSLHPLDDLKVTRPWCGEDLAGCTILLTHEQGFGDAIMFGRYVPMVAAMAKETHLFVIPALVPIMQFEGVQTHTIGDDIPSYHYCCQLPSLARAFKTTVDTVPAPMRIAGHGTPPGNKTIGITWRGNPKHPNDAHRSMSVRDVEPLLAAPGVKWVSLQRDANEVERAVLNRHNIAQPRMSGFGEAAEVVSGLDAVVTIDSAYAHLSGSMGKPTIVMLQDFLTDWRWLRDGVTTPWYPSAVLVRQAKDREWRDVVETVRGMVTL